MLELNGGLGVLTCTLYLDDGTNTKALVLNLHTLMEIPRTGIRRHRTRRHGPLHRLKPSATGNVQLALKTVGERVNRSLRFTRSHGARLGICLELRGHWSGVLHPFRTPATTSEERFASTDLAMDIQEVRIDIPDESGWGVVLHPSVAPTVLCTGQDAMLLGPGDRHIEQSALFFEFAHRVRTHRRREDILLKTHHEHRRELQTLG